MTRHLSRAIGVVLTALLSLTLVTSAQESTPDALPEAGEPVAEGRYTDDRLGPSLEFRVGEGWRVGPDVTGPIITLESNRVPGGVLTFTRFDGEAFTNSCDRNSNVSVDVSLQRVAEIIGANPLLRVAPPVIADVDGNRAVQLDVGVPAIEDCESGFLLLWIVAGMAQGEFIQVPDQQSRFVLVQVEEDVIVFAIESFPGVPFGPVLEGGMDIIDSIRITPRSQVQPASSPEPSAGASAEPGESAAPSTPEPAPRTPTPLATAAPDA